MPPYTSEEREQAVAHFVAETDRLIEAVMEARSEYREGASGLVTLRHEVEEACRAWSAAAYLSPFNPFMADAAA